VTLKPAGPPAKIAERRHCLAAYHLDLSTPEAACRPLNKFSRPLDAWIRSQQPAVTTRSDSTWQPSDYLSPAPQSGALLQHGHIMLCALERSRARVHAVENGGDQTSAAESRYLKGECHTRESHASLMAFSVKYRFETRKSIDRTPSTTDVASCPGNASSAAEHNGPCCSSATDGCRDDK